MRSQDHEHAVPALWRGLSNRAQEAIGLIAQLYTVEAAIRYALTRMERLRPDHGILELDNNPAERSMRAIALGRKNYLFVGSEAGGKAAAIAYT